MSRIRRKRLHVRQSLAYREGKSADSSWSVGYWDRTKSINPDQDFRSFGSRPTQEEAEAFATQLAKEKKYLYIFG